LKAWAGPQYWKLAPVRTRVENKENVEDVAKSAAVKRTRRGKVKDAVDIFQVKYIIIQ